MGFYSRIFSVLSFVGCLISLTACKSISEKYLRNELLKITDWEKTLQYSDQLKTDSIKVILYYPQSTYGLRVFPGWIIGSTKKGDTVAIISRKFNPYLKLPKTILVDTYKWSNEEKDILKPIYPIWKNKKRNSIYFHVKECYYGIIDTNLFCSLHSVK